MKKMPKKLLITFDKLAAHVQEAIRVGKEASEKSADGGSANLDHVVLTGLKGVRLQALTSLGIPASKGRHSGYFPLDTFFGGQGDKNAVGVKAMSEHLTEVGVAHYVHYQLD